MVEIRELELKNQKGIPRGLVTEYSEFIGGYANKYILENKRVKKPIINNLKEIINVFEYKVIGNYFTNKVYCIWNLEIDTNNLKLDVIGYDIKEKNADKISFSLEMRNFNKNWIDFVNKLSIEFPKDEETNKKFELELVYFTSKIDEELLKAIKEVLYPKES